MVPKLIDFDWRVDIKTGSYLANTDASNKSGQQTCILQLKVNFKNLLRYKHRLLLHAILNTFDQFKIESFV